MIILNSKTKTLIRSKLGLINATIWLPRMFLAIELYLLMAKYTVFGIRVIKLDLSVNPPVIFILPSARFYICPVSASNYPLHR